MVTLVSTLLYLLLTVTSESHAVELSSKTYQIEQEIIWIDYYTVPCVGVGSQLCFRAKHAKNLSFMKWEYFYREIEGFNYQIGYRYKLLVNVKKNEQFREDKSTLTYELDRILEKIKVERKIKLEIYPGELIFEESTSKFFLIDTLQIEDVSPVQKSQLIQAISEQERLFCTFDIFSNQSLKLLDIRRR
ncbi:MAG: DUF4377 domain-containing protein [Bacteroidota bacterium]